MRVSSRAEDRSEPSRFFDIRVRPPHERMDAARLRGRERSSIRYRYSGSGRELSCRYNTYGTTARYARFEMDHARLKPGNTSPRVDRIAPHPRAASRNTEKHIHIIRPPPAATTTRGKKRIAQDAASRRQGDSSALDFPGSSPPRSLDS